MLGDMTGADGEAELFIRTLVMAVLGILCRTSEMDWDADVGINFAGFGVLPSEPPCCIST